MTAGAGKDAGRRPGFAGFAVRAALVAGALAAVGFVVSHDLAGPGAAAAALAGCAISLAASLVGGLVIARGGGDPRDSATRALGAMGLRLAAVAVLAALVALSGLVPVKPLLLWTAIGYAVLLAVDTHYAVAAAKAG